MSDSDDPDPSHPQSSRKRENNRKNNNQSRRDHRPSLKEKTSPRYPKTKGRTTKKGRKEGREYKKHKPNRGISPSPSPHTRDSSSSEETPPLSHPKSKQKENDLPLPFTEKSLQIRKPPKSTENLPLRESSDVVGERASLEYSSEDSSVSEELTRRTRSTPNLVHIPTPIPPLIRKGESNKIKKSPNAQRSDLFIGHEITAIEDFLEREGAFVVVDAEDLVQNFKKAFSEVSSTLLKPNVLITGITGAGKSSLVNAIFGQNIAATGTGVPLTQHFTKYESKDMRVVIYDSKGLEHGQFEEFIRSTNQFFENHKPGIVGEADAIHVIWYIINSAHSRWEPFEERICRELLNKAPLMFVLNKADISSPKDICGMRKLISQMNLPNCAGVFETIAQPSNKLKKFDVCPNCKSDDLVLRTKTAKMTCLNCKYSESLRQNDGFSKLIEATCNVLPDVLRDAFISAQNVNFHLKEEYSREILEDFWNVFTQVRTPAKLLRIIAQMMARLSIIWEFKKRGNEYGQFMARDLVGAFTFKEKLNLLFQNKIEVQRKHITALGILWNRCLRDLALELFQVWSNSENSELVAKSKKLNSTCSGIFNKIFSQMNEHNLLSIEEALTNQGLRAVLDEEARCLDEDYGGFEEGVGRFDV